MSDSLCERCGNPVKIGEWPFCPHGYGTFTVSSDSIPGGLEIRHGLCNPDGTPRKYYSKTEIATEAKRRGLQQHVEHVTEPGTDKAKYTQRMV